MSYPPKRIRGDNESQRLGAGLLSPERIDNQYGHDFALPRTRGRGDPSRARFAMNVSGILVTAAPTRLEAVVQAISRLEWAEVHRTDAYGRLIVTVDSDSSEEGLQRFKALRGLPGVLAADLVMHCFEDEVAVPAPDTAATAELLSRDDATAPASHYSRLKAWSSV